MRHPFSLMSWLLIGLVAAGIRGCYIQPAPDTAWNALTYDAFGYYMYLPAALIYGDMTDPDWIEPMHARYRVKGGDKLYQTIVQADGRHVYKYLGGVALMQLPFFLCAHGLAPVLGFPADGFSAPYQGAVILASFFYGLLGLWVLRRVLLRYYSDRITAAVLVLITLATNWVQYIAVDGAMSHIYIFPLYALILHLTRMWHEHPRSVVAWAGGWVIGLATICRPTELIMLFIPLLWGLHTREAARAKWALVQQHLPQAGWALAGGLMGLLPQLVYWHYATGHFLFDVGSKWNFLSPWIRVLTGFEKGWFVYTPVTILFVVGFWYMRGQPFRVAVITFCLLNFWIVTAWSDWRYGASYSARALVQSYPVLALALAGLLTHIARTRWRLPVAVLAGYLLIVNLFQIYQYNAGILRYDENSLEYYRSIYLNPGAKAYE
ncbi:MAG: hypothetical protein SF053_14990 [Bacteroidia bacterium]|nr:hypothetical protein [Bacteroidia bacterium]